MPDKTEAVRIFGWFNVILSTLYLPFFFLPEFANFQSRIVSDTTVNPVLQYPIACLALYLMSPWALLLSYLSFFMIVINLCLNIYFGLKLINLKNQARKGFIGLQVFNLAGSLIVCMTGSNMWYPVPSLGLLMVFYISIIIFLMHPEVTGLVDYGQTPERRWTAAGRICIIVGFIEGISVFIQSLWTMFMTRAYLSFGVPVLFSLACCVVLLHVYRFKLWALRAYTVLLGIDIFVSLMMLVRVQSHQLPVLFRIVFLGFLIYYFNSPRIRPLFNAPTGEESI